MRAHLFAAALVAAVFLSPVGLAANGVADATAADPAGTSAAAATAPEPAAPVPGAAEAAVLKALGSWEPAAFIDAMESDRLLLAEMRKDLPQDRAEADTWLLRLKLLAAISDPVRLVPKVNRLIELAPTYYDWLEKSNKATTQAQQAAAQNEYTVSGARGFIVSIQDFENLLLLTVINRLEIAAEAVRAAAGLFPG